MNIQLAAFVCSILLIIIGIVAIVFFDNFIKKILGLMFLSDGVNLALITIGYKAGGIIPIFDSSMGTDVVTFANNAAFPLSFALVLTNIVIAVSTMAVCLGLAIKIYHSNQSINASDSIEEEGKS